MKMMLGTLVAISATCAFASTDGPYGNIIDLARTQAAATALQIPEADEYPNSGDCKAPSNSSCTWTTDKAGSWTCGFYPGLLWKLANESRAEGDEAGFQKWSSEALRRTLPISGQQTNTGTHDVGFMVFYSFGHGYKLTNNESLKEVAITTAHSLATRFSPVVGCIRSWNGPHFRVIIDNMMNLELLFWAAEASNNETLRSMAVSHATRMATCGMIREDGCSFHLVDFNETSGAVISRSSLPQGYSNDSIWSRGQAWAVYGYVIAYRYTGDPVFLRMAEVTAGCFLEQLKSCCSDNVPLFDFAYPGKQRDASAGAIAASGLVELAWMTGNNDYRDSAKLILDGLTQAPYLGVAGQTDTLLLHSVGAWPDGDWDLPESYADYYLLEAILKYRSSA